MTCSKSEARTAIALNSNGLDMPKDGFSSAGGTSRLSAARGIESSKYRRVVLSRPKAYGQTCRTGWINAMLSEKGHSTRVEHSGLSCHPGHRVRPAPAFQPKHGRHRQCCATPSLLRPILKQRPKSGGVAIAKRTVVRAMWVPLCMRTGSWKGLCLVQREGTAAD